jgi:hypothetical protein
MKMQLLVLEAAGADHTPMILQRLNERFRQIKAVNPRGFLDSFEAQIETICLDIAFALGGRYASSGDLLGFNFSAMSQEAFERRVEDAAAMTPSRIAASNQEIV